MTRICAYCDGNGPLTREHVWPSCFLEREGRVAAHFSHKSGRVHGADYQVGDVCAPCNNTRLSPLDAYFCELYDEYFHTLHDFDSSVSFRFRFDDLLRALLKIAYNSARCGGSDARPFQAHRRYILGEESLQPGVALFGELVSPSVVSNAEEPDEPKKVMPLMYRSAITGLMTEAGRQVQTRIVAVRSFYFHLALQPPGVAASVFETAVSDLGRLIQGVVRLQPGQGHVTMRSSPQDGLRSMAPHIEAHRGQYEQFFAGRRSSAEGDPDQGSA